MSRAALIPEAIAFSIIAGVDPKVGLYASFSMAVVTAIVGGRLGLIFCSYWSDGVAHDSPGQRSWIAILVCYHDSDGNFANSLWCPLRLSQHRSVYKIAYECTKEY